MDAASLPDDLRFMLKAAVRDLVQRCGGLVRAAVIAGVSKSQLHRYGAADAPDMIDTARALALELDCGLPLVTGILAGAHGRGLTDPSGDNGPKDFLATSFTAAEAVAEADAEHARAARDGVISPNEAEGLARRDTDAILAIKQRRQSLAPALGGTPIRVG